MESKLELIEQLQNLLLDAEAVGYKLWQMQGAYEDTIDGQMMGHIYDADWCLNQFRKETARDAAWAARDAAGKAAGKAAWAAAREAQTEEFLRIVQGGEN